MDALTIIAKLLGFERAVAPVVEHRPDFVDTRVTVYTRTTDDDRVLTERWWAGEVQEA